MSGQYSGGHGGSSKTWSNLHTQILSRFDAPRHQSALRPHLTPQPKESSWTSLPPARDASFCVFAPRTISRATPRPKRPPHASTARSSARASVPTSPPRLAGAPTPRAQTSQQRTEPLQPNDTGGRYDPAAGGAPRSRYARSAARRQPVPFTSARIDDASLHPASRCACSAPEETRDCRRDQSAEEWKSTQRAGCPSRPALPLCW